MPEKLRGEDFRRSRSAEYHEVGEPAAQSHECLEGHRSPKFRVAHDLQDGNEIRRPDCDVVGKHRHVAAGVRPRVGVVLGGRRGDANLTVGLEILGRERSLFGQARKRVLFRAREHEDVLGKRRRVEHVAWRDGRVDGEVEFARRELLDKVPQNGTKFDADSRGLLKERRETLRKVGEDRVVDASDAKDSGEVRRRKHLRIEEFAVISDDFGDARRECFRLGCRNEPVVGSVEKIVAERFAHFAEQATCASDRHRAGGCGSGERARAHQFPKEKERIRIKRRTKHGG